MREERAGLPILAFASLHASETAKRAFEALDRTNRYAILYRVQEAKKPETRARRIAGFVAMLERGDAPYPRKRERVSRKDSVEGGTQVRG